MQRPNFQFIEDQPEKNYMRFVSQYKLDDMVTKKNFIAFFINETTFQFRRFFLAIKNEFFPLIDGKAEAAEL